MFNRHLIRSRPLLEVLEDRLALATRVWDGGALSNNWTNASNWQGNIAPLPGDDLVFPAGAGDKVADNNFPTDTIFQSITVGGGYTLRGARVQLGTGGIIDNSASSNNISFKLLLSGNRSIHVGNGSTLFLSDEISGSGGVIKTGSGNLSFRSNNSYSGLTDVQSGILFIEKDESLGSFGSNANGTLIRSNATLLVNDQALGTIRTDELFTVEHQGNLRGVNDVHLRGNITTLGQMQFRHDGGLIERMLVTGKISGPGSVLIGVGGGQVWFQGNSANTYQGLTNVLGKLRLDNSNGDAIPGSLFISSTGSVRYQRNDQIADDATVTVHGGGFLLVNEKDDTFHKLVLNGGTISGDKLGIDDYVPPLIVNFVGGLIRNPIFSAFFGGGFSDRESDITLNEITATSTSTEHYAQLIDLNMDLTSADGLVRVSNGPAVTDFYVFGYMSSVPPEGEESNLTLEGQGSTMVQDFPASNYFVNEGVLQFAKLQRDLVTPNHRFVDVTVGAGAKFIGDVAIQSLYVESGGTVKPGPIHRPVIVDAVYTQFITGVLSIQSELTMEPGAILEVQLNSPVAGTGHEQLDVLGTVSIDGAIIKPTVGPNLIVGHNYRVINNSGTDPITGFIAVPPASSPNLTALPTGQKLSVNHAGGLLNNDLVLTLQNTPPMAPGIQLTSTEINEGESVRVNGRLVDPDAKDKLRLFINWGDGSRQEVYFPGRNPFSYSHQYKRDGVYTARFEWLDQTGQGNSREFTITVNNVAPTLDIRTFRSAASGLLLTSGWLSDTPGDRFTLTVDYGDGSPIRCKTHFRRDAFALSHRYQQPGTYTVTFTLRDDKSAEHVEQRDIVIP